MQRHGGEWWMMPSRLVQTPLNNCQLLLGCSPLATHISHKQFNASTVQATLKPFPIIPTTLWKWHV